GWEARPEARLHIPHLPSQYLRRFYSDTITWSEAALRFLIDTVGADRVVLGSDFPYDMGPESPVRWLEAMERITAEEKGLILGQNLERLLEL
ncbi:MAG: amidohydrolase family protein, partial [Chloroflexi bacterium]|nr:amidohydrolase family protein [Chloroflexota bacterium]